MLIKGKRQTSYNKSCGPHEPLRMLQLGRPCSSWFRLEVVLFIEMALHTHRLDAFQEELNNWVHKKAESQNGAGVHRVKKQPSKLGASF